MPIGKLVRRMFAQPKPPPRLEGVDYEKAALLVALVNDASQPNINAIWELSKNVNLLSLNVKALGYELARTMSAALPTRTDTVARIVGLGSKPSTQSDIESDWVAHWCAELKCAVLFHRKVWEAAYVLQALHEGGRLAPGQKGVGFGCGSEPFASYFASRGAAVTITDLDSGDARSAGWSNTAQHAAERDAAFHPHLVDRDTFDRLVSFRAVDMNAIPADLAGYDFCWSMCAFEHLGSIEQGLAFVERSLDTLVPGGTAVHTTEFNINPDGPTIDNWPTVLFQRRHMEELGRRLRAKGHIVAPFDFDTGDKPLDRFIDLPPWADGTLEAVSAGLGQPYHLKVGVDGFVATCFGITVTKAA